MICCDLHRQEHAKRFFGMLEHKATHLVSSAGILAGCSLREINQENERSGSQRPVVPQGRMKRSFRGGKGRAGVEMHPYQGTLGLEGKM